MDFHCRVNFTRAKKIETMYERSRIHVNVKLRSTFTRGLLYMASILVTHVKFTCVRTLKLRDNGNPPLRDVKFTRVNEMEIMYKVSRVNVKVERGSNARSTFTRDLSYITSNLFTYTLKLRGSGNPRQEVFPWKQQGVMTRATDGHVQ